MKILRFMNEDNWTTECLARNAAGRSVEPESESATKWCLIGHAYKHYPNYIKRQQVIKKLRKELKKWGMMPQVYCTIADFNDRVPFELVKRLVERTKV